MKSFDIPFDKERAADSLLSVVIEEKDDFVLDDRFKSGDALDNCISGLSDRLYEAIEQAYREMLIDELINSYGFNISLPILFSPNSDGGFGKAVDDPLLLDFYSERSGVRARYSLKQKIESEIAFFEEEDGWEPHALKAISGALLDLSKKIDAAIARKDER